MPIIVFQHSDDGTSGRLGTTLRDHAFDLDIIRPDTGDPVPKDLDETEGLVVLGGAQNVDEGHAWMDAELECIRRAHHLQLPVVGICLGHQLIAKALGGTVERMEKPEWGFHQVRIEPMGQVSAVLAGLAWSHPQVCSHGYQVVEPPPGAIVTASSEGCRVQAFRAGLRTYGFQFHFECDRRMIRTMFEGHKRELTDAGLTLTDVLGQIEEHYGAYERHSGLLCQNLASFAFVGGRREAR